MSYFDAESEARELAASAREHRRRSRRQSERPSTDAPYVVTCTIVIDAPTLADARRKLSRALAGVPGFRKGEYAPWAARAVRG